MPKNEPADQPSPQERRENVEPYESRTPIPRWIFALIAVLVVWGIYYIASAPINSPSELGDRRTIADLEPQKASSGGAIDGAAVFASHCVSCHQATGLGLPGVFPPLAGSEWAQGKETTVAAILLHGINGPLTVKGNKFNGTMPSFGSQLNDGEIAAVLTYVRSQWGNTAPPIKADVVAQVRAATKDKTGSYNGDDELGKLNQ